MCSFALFCQAHSGDIEDECHILVVCSIYVTSFDINTLWITVQPVVAVDRTQNSTQRDLLTKEDSIVISTYNLTYYWSELCSISTVCFYAHKDGIYLRFKLLSASPFNYGKF